MATQEQSTGRRRNQVGKLVIGLMFALAVGASVWSLQHHRRRGQRALALWGASSARLMVEAPRVELCQLDPTGRVEKRTVQQTILAGGVSLPVVRRIDISHARGLANVRRGLLSDSSFDWEHSPSGKAPRWVYALIFSDGQQSVTLLFSQEKSLVGLADGGVSASVLPVSDGLAEFIEEQLHPQRRQE